MSTRFFTWRVSPLRKAVGQPHRKRESVRVVLWAHLENRPSQLISASAVGYYGNRGEAELTESATPAKDFLAGVCIDWEAEAMAAEASGIRVVTARTGIALGAGGGALQRMLTPFKMGAGGPLGNGKQWMPWIHVADMAGLYMHAATTVSLRGPMNAVRIRFATASSPRLSRLQWGGQP